MSPPEQPTLSEIKAEKEQCFSINMSNPKLSYGSPALILTANQKFHHCSEYATATGGQTDCLQQSVCG